MNSLRVAIATESHSRPEQTQPWGRYKMLERQL